MMESNINNGRRKFLIKTSSTLAAGLFVGSLPVLMTSCESSTDTYKPSPYNINIESHPELNIVNGFKMLTISGKNNDKPIIIIRKSNESFITISSVCPHEGCTVNLPDILKNEIKCPCHESRFQIDGALINGPAKTGLKVFSNSFNSMNNVLTIMI